jgi:hemerythrin-like domain-containing protein
MRIGNQIATETPRSAGLLRGMHDDHVAMAGTLRELAEQAHQGDAAAMRTTFDALERAVSDHLDCEDARLLPRFADVDPEEAAGLREEHMRIRRRLMDLGIALELHTLRAGMIDDFIDLLYRHAVREERALYAWTERALPIAERHALFSGVLAQLEDRLAHR